LCKAQNCGFLQKSLPQRLALDRQGSVKNMNGKKRHKRGRKPKHLKLGSDWQSAVNKALKKEKPKEGWPKKKK
jgi:hypothetical protein